MSAPGEAVALVEAGENHLQRLLDAMAHAGIYRPHPIVHLPLPADQRLHELDRAFGIGLGGRDEIVVSRHQALGGAQRLHRGRPRPGIDQAHLAEYVTGLERADVLGPRAFADAHLDRTGGDEKSRIASLTFSEDRIPGIELHSLHRKGLFR